MEIKQFIKEFIEARKQMCLATSDEKHPWICTVWYVVDEEMNFYFLSALETIHIQQILKNSKAAITITDSPQNNDDNKTAVQLWGNVERITDVQKVQWFINNWTDKPENYSAEEIANSEEKGVFCVKPKQMKLVNKGLVKNSLGYRFI